jgi:hypothetical protein
MSTTGSHLRALPAPADLFTPGAHGGEPANAAELAARQEVTRARRELPQVDHAVWDCYLGGSHSPDGRHE